MSSEALIETNVHIEEQENDSSLVKEEEVLHKQTCVVEFPQDVDNKSMLVKKKRIRPTRVSSNMADVVALRKQNAQLKTRLRTIHHNEKKSKILLMRLLTLNADIAFQCLGSEQPTETTTK